MLGCKHAVGDAEEGVATRRENLKTLVRAVDLEIDVRAFGFAYPVSLRGFGGFGPVDIFKPFQKSFGIFVYVDYPLFHIFADDGITAALGLAVDNFVVGEHGAELLAPVYGRFDVAGKPRFVKLFEYPLRPFKVRGGASGNCLVPVVGQSKHFKLCGKGLYIVLREAFGVVTRLNCILFRGQTEAVEAYGVQNVEALHALHSRKDIRRRIAFGVSDVQTRARGIGEHIQNIIFGL